jgi:hypothetical protein
MGENRDHNLDYGVPIFQLFGIVSTLVAERLLDGVDDDRVANGVLCGVLLVGVAITAAIKPDYRRQATAKRSSDDKESIL